VLSVLDEVLPCEGALIHVFDINTSHFVVVRAKGPNARDVLLQSLRDNAPFGCSSFDAPAVRAIAREATPNGYRWSSLILGIVNSPAFLMRAAPVATN